MFFFQNRIFAAVTFGGQALGRASALTPDIGRAKIAAAKIFELLDRRPPIDSSDKSGNKPVRVFLVVVIKLYEVLIQIKRSHIKTAFT